MQQDTTADTALTDSIERSVLIQAPRERVWHALANAEVFGTWFGADLKGKRFEPGQRTQGPITIPNMEHLAFDVIIERMEAPSLMSYRWHPCCGDEGEDENFSDEPRTLVIFRLADLPDNQTRLTVVETGFDNLHPQRRLKVFRGNTQGWIWQLGRLATHAEA
jgi:uncharacterized protein YndB with AHSA1/START domain